MLLLCLPYIAVLIHSLIIPIIFGAEHDCEASDYAVFFIPLLLLSRRSKNAPQRPWWERKFTPIKL